MTRAVRPFISRLLTGLLVLAATPCLAEDDLARAVQESYPTNLSMLTDAANSAVSEMFLNFGFPEGSTILLEAENAHEARWFVENLLLERLTEGGYRVHLQGGLSRQGDAGLSSGGSPPGTGAPTGMSMADAMNQTAATADSTADEAGTGDTAAGDGEGDGAEDSPETGSTPGAAAASGAAGLTPTPTDFIFRFRVAECGLIYPKSYRKSPLGSRTVQRLATVSLFSTLVQGDEENVVWVGRGDAERLDHVPASKLPLLEGNTFPFTQPELNTRGLGAYVEPILVTAIVVGLIYLFYTNQ